MKFMTLRRVAALAAFAWMGAANAQVDVNSFVSLLAVKGVPAPVRAQIHADVLKVLQEPEVREKFNTFAFEPLSWSVEEIQRQAGVKSEQYKLLIQKANISLE